MYDIDDTIVAIATPAGESALALIRIAGEQSSSILKQIFKHPKMVVFVPKPFTTHFGEIYSNGKIIDSVIAVYFPRPKSSTGQDQVEISCHGGYFVCKKILDLIVSSGARLAQPGEFTYRSFLNGKLDLVQCEAVADIIHSKSAVSHQSALAQYEGHLSKKILALRETLLTVCSLIELELDFSTEDLEFIKKNDLLVTLTNLQSQLLNLIDTFRFGRIHREGIAVAIIGEPNVGKSSLLNCLLQEDRSIVTEHPGTTRDTIEESVDFRGQLIKFIDTAGIRDSFDKAETMGIERTQKAIQTADMILMVIDVSKNLSKTAEHLFNLLYPEKIILFVGNKVDLGISCDLNMYKDRFVYISALKNQGIAELKNKIFNLINFEKISHQSHIVTNVRHKDALEKASFFVLNAINSLKNNMSNDFIAADLRNSIEFLEIIIGKVTSDDILSYIFSRFCIGK